MNLIHLFTLLFSLIILLTFLFTPSSLSFIRHSTTHYLLVRTFAHSLSLSLSRSCPYRFRAPFSFSLPPYSFAVSVNSPSDFDECNSEISSSRRELVILGRAAQRSSIYAHTLCGDNPATGAIAKYSLTHLKHNKTTIERKRELNEDARTVNRNYHDSHAAMLK